MGKEEFLKSNKFKIFLPVFIVAMVIVLWKEGYVFGQWLYEMIHR